MRRGIRCLASFFLIFCPPLEAVEPPAVSWNASPNYTWANREISHDIDAIVIHTTEGTYSSSLSFAGNQEKVFLATLSWFESASSGVSSHYVVSGTGEIVQMVKDKDIAWHATYYNSRSIGIECAGWASKPETWNEANLDALAHLVAWLCEKYDVPVGHPPGDAKTSGGWYGEPGIVGHNQVQTSGSAAGTTYATKTDPGPYFPWDDFVAAVKAKIGPPPAAPVGLAAIPDCSGSTPGSHFFWYASPGAEGYWLDLAESEADLDGMKGTFQNIHVGTMTSFSWFPLEASTAYYWRVFAYNASGGAHGYPAGPVWTSTCLTGGLTGPPPPVTGPPTSPSTSESAPSGGGRSKKRGLCFFARGPDSKAGSPACQAAAWVGMIVMLLLGASRVLRIFLLKMVKVSDMFPAFSSGARRGFRPRGRGSSNAPIDNRASRVSVSRHFFATPG